MDNLKQLAGPTRPPFLILSPACVLLGAGVAAWTTGAINLFYLALALIGTLAAHISVNAFNEYVDFKTGLDARTTRTPFSGGSGTLPANPALTSPTLAMAIITLIATGLIGLYFVLVRGLALLPLGLVGLAIVVVYTSWMTRHSLLCLIAPGLGFGPLVVIGTFFVLTGHYAWTALIASLAPFFLVSNLLLLNQFPDVEADRYIGRRHLPIVAGRRFSSLVYGLFTALAFGSIGVGVGLGYLPRASLIGLLALPAALPAMIGAYRHANHLDRLMPAMSLNVLVNILTPMLVAVGLFISA